MLYDSKCFITHNFPIQASETLVFFYKIMCLLLSKSWDNSKLIVSFIYISKAPLPHPAIKICLVKYGQMLLEEMVLNVLLHYYQ